MKGLISRPITNHLAKILTNVHVDLSYMLRIILILSPGTIALASYTALSGSADCRILAEPGSGGLILRSLCDVMFGYGPKHVDFFSNQP